MAWIAVDLDDTLVQKAMDPETGEPTDQDEPIEGAVEAMTQLASEGHRLSVFTSRFGPAPESEKQRLKEDIEATLQQLGFPEMEVWTGTTKPSADIFIDDKAVTFDQDWGLALAQLQYMLEERGLTPGPQPNDGSVPPEEGEDGDGSVGG
jgi:hypothetical protein